MLLGTIVGAAGALALAPIDIKGELVSLVGAIVGTLITVVGTYLVSTGEVAVRERQERSMFLTPLEVIRQTFTELEKGPPPSCTPKDLEGWFRVKRQAIFHAEAVLVAARARVAMLNPGLEVALNMLTGELERTREDLHSAMNKVVRGDVSGQDKIDRIAYMMSGLAEAALYTLDPARWPRPAFLSNHYAA